MSVDVLQQKTIGIEYNVLGISLVRRVLSGEHSRSYVGGGYFGRYIHRVHVDWDAEAPHNLTVTKPDGTPIKTLFPVHLQNVQLESPTIIPGVSRRFVAMEIPSEENLTRVERLANALHAWREAVGCA